MKLISAEKENLRFNPTRMASPQRETMKTIGGTGFEITILIVHDFLALFLGTILLITIFIYRIKQS